MEAVEKEIEELVAWMVGARDCDLKTIEDGLKERGNKLLLKVLKEGLRESEAPEGEVGMQQVWGGSHELGSAPQAGAPDVGRGRDKTAVLLV